MYFQPFYLTCLAHASYMLGADGLAAVVDPQRDVEIYLEEARRRNLRIAYIIETHLHADFVSGHRELSARTGAQICISAEARAQFPHRAMHHGDTLSLGSCQLRFLSTPGHTPESMCVLVSDTEKSPQPWGVLTGDTLFIGDVGRPDLSPELTPQQLAGMLYDSLHGQLLKLDDAVEVFPAHGAGSLCGRNISSDRSSTIGRERQFNYALQLMSREQFILLLTDDLPERPGYFSRDAELNRSGAEQLGNFAPLEALTAEQVHAAITAHPAAILLDTRPSQEFAAAHIRGSVHIGLGGQYASWAATLIGLDREVILVAEQDHLEESRLRLARVGIERVRGYLAGGLAGWERNPALRGLLVQTAQISVGELHRMLQAGEDIQVLDVRRQPEWNAGHIASARLLPLARFACVVADDVRRTKELLAGLDAARPVAVHCKSGYRSAIASSLLERAGFTQVINVLGGFDAWTAQTLPAEAPSSAPIPA